MTQRIDTYLEEMYLYEEITLISEDVSSFLKKFTPEKFKTMAKDAKNALKAKKPEKLINVVKRLKVPTVSIDKLTSVGNRMSDDFRENYKLAKRVIDNSLPSDVNEDLKKASAFFLAAKNVINKGEFKTAIRKFVDLVRYLANKAKKVLKEVPESTIVEGVIGWTIIILITWFVVYMILAPGIIYGLPWWSGLMILALSWVALIFANMQATMKGESSIGDVVAGYLTNKGDQYVTPPTKPAGSPQGPQLF